MEKWGKLLLWEGRDSANFKIEVNTLLACWSVKTARFLEQLPLMVKMNCKRNEGSTTFYPPILWSMVIFGPLIVLGLYDYW